MAIEMANNATQKMKFEKILMFMCPPDAIVEVEWPIIADGGWNVKQEATW